MIIDLKQLNFYFLTFNNEIRKNHILEEFKDYNLLEINPNHHPSKFISGCSGFLKIIDKALQDQDRTKEFKPFVLIEDDVTIFDKSRNIITIPDDSDLLYLGISKCGSNDKYTHDVKMCSRRINNDISRIYNMLSTHGIMICSMVGAGILQKCILEAYYTNIHYDLPISKIQPYYNIYCLNKPFVYQDKKYGGQEDVTRYIITNNISNMPASYLNTSTMSIITSTKSVDKNLNLY